MKRVKLLWISRYVPISTAASGGSQTFNFYFKQFMQDSRFEIRLIAFGKEHERNVAEKENEQIIHRIIYQNNQIKFKKRRLINIESRFNPYNRNGGLISNTEQIEVENTLIEYKKAKYEPDIIILEWTNMVMLAHIVRKFFPDSVIVASEHDVTFLRFYRNTQYYSGLKKLFWLQKYKTEKKRELENLKLCDLILPHNAGNKRLLVAEGINDTKVHGLVPYHRDLAHIKRKSNRRDILFFGDMSRMENILSVQWFIKYVIPRLNDLEIRFVIMGNTPPESLKRQESDKIHITGFVKAIDQYFAESMCFVAPLVLGAGIKIKVLEALSSGIPVLTNELGIEGIPAVNQRDYFCCIEPKDYEKIIRKLYNCQIDEEELSKNAKRMVANLFSIKQFSSLYRNELFELHQIHTKANIYERR